MFGRSFTHGRLPRALLAGVLLLGLAGLAVAGGVVVSPPVAPGPGGHDRDNDDQNRDFRRWLAEHAQDLIDAGGQPAAPVLPPPPPMPLGFTGVFRLGTFRIGDFQGRTSYIVSAAAVSNIIDDATAPSDLTDNLPNPRPDQIIKLGMTVQLAVPNEADATRLPAPQADLYKPLKDSRVGSLMKIELEVLPGQGVGTVVSAEPYKMAPGEDKPGVFVFQRTTTQTVQNVDRPAVVLGKFLQETTLIVTDKKVLAALDNFQTGDSVKVALAGNTLKSIAPYKP